MGQIQKKSAIQGKSLILIIEIRYIYRGMSSQLLQKNVRFFWLLWPADILPDIFWCAIHFRYNSYDFKNNIFVGHYFLIFSSLCMMTYHSNIFPPWFLSNPICLSWCFLFILESFCSLQLHDYSSATFPWVVNVWRDHFVIDSMASKPCVTCALSKRDDVHIRGIDQINIKIQTNHKSLSLLFFFFPYLTLIYSKNFTKFHTVQFHEKIQFMSAEAVLLLEADHQKFRVIVMRWMQCFFRFVYVCIPLFTFVYIRIIYNTIPNFMKLQHELIFLNCSWIWWINLCCNFTKF